MSTLREAGIPIACNTHVNAQNWRALPQLADVLVGLGPARWEYSIDDSHGKSRPGAESCGSSHSTCSTSFRSLHRSSKSVPLAGSKSPRLDVAHFLDRTSTRCAEGCPNTVTPLAGGVGVSMISIDTAGNATGCAALDAGEVCAGNVRTHALRELWDNAPELRIGVSPSHVHGYCAECYYSRICRGGCTGVAIGLTGQRGDNPYCHHRALEFARRGLRERLVLRGVETRGRRGHNLFDIQVEPMPAD